MSSVLKGPAAVAKLRREGYAKVGLYEEQVLRGDSPNLFHGIDVTNLPKLKLHGFSVDPGEVSDASINLDKDLIPQLIPYLAAPQNEYTSAQLDIFLAQNYDERRAGLGVGSPTEMQRNAYIMNQKAAINAARLRFMKGDPALLAAVLEADMTGDIELTRFVTDMTWEHTINPPYTNGVITLKLPAVLCNYVFHGRIADITHDAAQGNFTNTRGFRHIQAGGWSSIYFDDVAIFLGKILSVQINTEVDSRGVFMNTVILNLSNFIYPLLVSEHRSTSNPTIDGWGIDSGAISSTLQKDAVDAQGNPREEILSRFARIFSTSQDAVPAKVLQDLVTYFGHHRLPDVVVDLISRLVGRQEKVNIGSNIKVLSGGAADLVNTPYSLQSSNIDSISQQNIRITESNYARSLNNTSFTSVWQLIRNIFQPDEKIIELFPVLLPTAPRGFSTSAGSDSATKEKSAIDNILGRSPVKDSDENLIYYTELAVGAGHPPERPLIEGDIRYKKGLGLTDLGRAINAEPVLIYRFRPLQPDFDGSHDSLKEHGLPAGNGPTAHERFFGKKDRLVDLKDRTGYRYLEIDSSMVQRQELSWSDMNRVNMVLVEPNVVSVAPDVLASSTYAPVFNNIDINRNGLRAIVQTLPFNLLGGASLEVFAAALAERIYYTVGEEHAYASGTITCVYIPSPNLLCGMWVKINYASRIPQTQTGQQPRKDLVAYVTGVQHSVSMGEDGKPQGTTTLTIERASYGGRIAYAQKHKAVAQITQLRAGGPQDQSREEVRPANNPQAPTSASATPQAGGVDNGDLNTPAPQTPEAPQASRKGGDSASPDARQTGTDPSRAAKTVSKTPAGYSKTDPKTPAPTAKRKAKTTTGQARQKATRNPATATAYSGVFPPAPPELYAAFLHYDDETVLPISPREYDADSQPLGTINADGSVSYNETSFVPYGTTPDTAFGQVWVRYTTPRVFRVDYVDGAVGFVLEIVDEFGNLLEFRRLSFSRGSVNITPPTRRTDFPSAGVLDFDPDTGDLITPR